MKVTKSFLFSLLMATCADSYAMERNEFPQQAPAPVAQTNTQHISLSAAKPLAIEEGFGQKFDYASLLKPDQKVSDAVYKRRLITFKRQLFDYIKGFSRLKGSSEEKSGTALTFIKEFHDFLSVIPLIIANLPFYKGERVTHYVPANAMRGIYKKEQIKEGTVAIFPHAKPAYLVHEPDAEALCILLARMDAKKIDGEQVLAKTASFFNEDQCSKEACIVYASYIFRTIMRRINAIISENKPKLASSIQEEDKKAIQICKAQCHLLKLEIVQKLLMSFPFFGRDENNETVYSKKAETILLELNKYHAILENLSKEYTTLYQRIQHELRTLKGKSLKKNTPIALAPSPAVDKENQEIERTLETIENPVPVTIKYANRVIKWFRQDFAQTQEEPDISYHTLLPTLADKFVIKHGEKSLYHNKTYPGQTDDLYTIAGKIKYDDSDEETYYLFNICLDPNGICYHRDCKKTEWEKLPLDLKKADGIEDYRYEEGTQEIIGAVGKKPQILQDAPAFVCVYNPSHKCTITLFKKLL